jgi:hypothetical protein
MAGAQAPATNPVLAHFATIAQQWSETIWLRPRQPQKSAATTPRPIAAWT